MDTIKFRLDKQYAPNTDFLGKTSTYLDDTTSFKNKYGEGISGKLDRFIVIIKENSVTIKDGSLTKFYFSNNLCNINRKQIKVAVGLLSEFLHLPINKADVLRFDFGINIKTEHKPSIYYEFLGEIKNHNRFLNSSTLYYNSGNKNTKLIFYDKIKEHKQKEKLLEDYRNTNLLRIEAQYLRRLMKHFNCNKLSVEMLYDKTFYNTLANDFYKYYLGVSKINNPIINFDLVKSITDLKDLSVGLLINCFGMNDLFRQIDVSFQKNKISSRQKFGLKKFLNEASKHPEFSFYSNEIAELDIKVMDTIQELLEI
jgi:hypothetical protein